MMKRAYIFASKIKDESHHHAYISLPYSDLPMIDDGKNQKEAIKCQYM